MRCPTLLPYVAPPPPPHPLASFRSSACPQEFSEVFPHLVTATDVPSLTKIEDVSFGDVDAGGCRVVHDIVAGCSVAQ